MKIRIAKKKLKKVLSEAYRINKRRVKLKRMDDLFSRRYGYSKSGPIFISYIRAPKTKKSMSLKKDLRLAIDAILGEDKAENKPAKSVEEVKYNIKKTNNMKINILDFFMATLQLAFIVLKICGVINWSWWVVLMPILFFAVINIAARLFLWWAESYKKRRLKKLFGTTNPLEIRMNQIQKQREELERKRKERMKQMNMDK